MSRAQGTKPRVTVTRPRRRAASGGNKALVSEGARYSSCPGRGPSNATTPLLLLLPLPREFGKGGARAGCGPGVAQQVANDAKTWPAAQDNVRDKGMKFLPANTAHKD